MSQRMDSIVPVVLAVIFGLAALQMVLVVFRSSPSLAVLLLILFIAGGVYLARYQQQGGSRPPLRPWTPWTDEQREREEQRAGGRQDGPTGVESPVLSPRRVGMVTLKEGKILEQWSVLLEGCQGEGEGVFRLVEEALTGYQAPGVTWTQESVAPSFWKAMAGKRRDYVLIRNHRFSDYLMAIGARDYGTSLDVSWYLLVSAGGILKQLLSMIPFMGLFLRMLGFVRGLDVFDQQDLRAYVTVGHHAVKHAVEDLLARRKLEVEIDWKSRGTLGVA